MQKLKKPKTLWKCHSRSDTISGGTPASLHHQCEIAMAAFLKSIMKLTIQWGTDKSSLYLDFNQSFMCMGDVPGCVSVYPTCKHCPQKKLEGGTGSTETGITESCESHHVGNGKWTLVFWRAASSLSHWTISPAPTELFDLFPGSYD